MLRCTRLALALTLLAGLLPAVVVAHRGSHPPHHGHDGHEEAARPIDGVGVRSDAPEMGAAGTPLVRLLEPDYADGFEAMAGVGRPGARAVSNGVVREPLHHGAIDNPHRTSSFLWAWGQFVDHDLDLTPGTWEWAPIPVPADDASFPPGSVIPFLRSVYHPETGGDWGTPREQMNEITSWLDASMVYGSDPARASALRWNDRTGRLRTSAGNLLPWNTDGFPNAGGNDPDQFLAGDIRANEQVALTALHTLFVREHNRFARRLARRRHNLSGDEIYERARRHVIALVQAITYREFLPALLGRRALDRYRGFDPEADAGITNVFSTAAFRFGHSAVPEKLLRLDHRLRQSRAGHLRLEHAFFAAWRIPQEGGIEPLLRGLAHQRHERVDPYVVEPLRSFLFGDPNDGGLDLAALNIQRGRDHGLPSYNATRRALGLRAARDFDDVSRDPEIVARLADTYADVEDIDLWAGGLAEDPVHGAHVGPTFFVVIAHQFEMLRDGDPYWYERSLPRAKRHEIQRTRLSHVIRRNTRIGREIPLDVFRVRGKPGRGRAHSPRGARKRRHR